MKKHFLKNSSSLLFESLSETLSATKFRKAVKTEFYVFRRTLWWKKKQFWNFFSDLEQTFSWILQKKGRKVVKASFYALRRTLWWKNIFLKKFYSFFLSLFENFSDFLTIFFKVDKTAFQVFRSTLWWKIYFFSKTLHKVPFRFWAKQFPTFETIFTKRLSKPFSTWSGNISRKQPLFFLFSLHFRILVKSSLKFRIEFPEKWWKLHSTFSDEHFDEKRRFWKWVFFRNFSKTFFWVLTKSIRQIVKTVFQVFKRTLWWKLMFLETFFFLLRNRILGSFLTFVIKVSAKLSNLHFTCSDEHFDEKKPFLKYSSSFLWLWPNFFLTSGKKNFKKDCQNRFLHVQTTFRGKRFTDFFCYWYIFGLWAKFFWQLPKKDTKNWQNCLLGVQTNTLVEKIFWKTLLQFSFRFWAKHFLIFGKNFTGRLSKPFSTWSGSFSRKHIFSIFFCFCCIFGFWAKVLWHLAENFLLCC